MPTSGNSGAMGELKVAADLMANDFSVFRNMGPNGPVDMVAVSPGGMVHLVQVTLGRRKGPWATSGFSSHGRVKIWNVLAICYPDKIEYRTREGKPMWIDRGELTAMDHVKVKTRITRQAKRPGIDNLPWKSPEERYKLAQQRMFQHLSSEQLDRIINDGQATRARQIPEVTSMP